MAFTWTSDHTPDAGDLEQMYLAGNLTVDDYHRELEDLEGNTSMAANHTAL